MRPMIARISDLLFGIDPTLRPGTALTLVSAGVYALSLLMLWHSVRAGMVDPTAAGRLTLLAMAGSTSFYLMLRSGRTARLRDPTVSMVQMTFAVVSLMLAYMICPHVRGMLLMVVALVLVFGAFNLSPGQCRRLGLFSVAALGGAMVYSMSIDPMRFEAFIEIHHLVFASTVLPTIAFLAGRLSALRSTQLQQKRELRDALELLRQKAHRDELTGLPNRHHVFDWIAAVDTQAATLWVALIDLDHFKRINDGHGHAVGDAVLRTFATVSGGLIEPQDLLARWGGEEFLLLMPRRDEAQAMVLLQRLRGAMKDARSWRQCPVQATFSCGLALHRPGEPIDRTIQRADRALYRAKHDGRDRIASERDECFIEETDPVI